MKPDRTPDRTEITVGAVLFGCAGIAGLVGLLAVAVIVVGLWNAAVDALVRLSERAMLVTYRARTPSMKGTGAREYAAIMAIVNAIGAYHHDMTLPWTEGRGTPRLLCVQAYRVYREAFEEAKAAHEEAVRRYVARFSWSKSDLAAKFGVVARFSPIPEPGDWRADLPIEDLVALRAGTEHHAAEVLRAALREPYARIEAVVGRMAKSLRAFRKGPRAEPRGRGRPPNSYFGDSLVTDVADLADILPLINLAGDPSLDALAKRIEYELTRITAAELREYVHLRREVADYAEAILRDIAAI